MTYPLLVQRERFLAIAQNLLFKANAISYIIAYEPNS